MRSSPPTVRSSDRAAFGVPARRAHIVSPATPEPRSGRSLPSPGRPRRKVTTHGSTVPTER
ncbi:hypothetical protein SEA_PIPERIS_55 [Microbacterium phage Piperis]|uniref:Uncharacterized protein n=1 Tax=Microbacterium phage Piperis TaxID=2584496 RepID=A0A4Y5NZY8_9CAUD|nr:hypothetical protein SEA_PIPERIS_55 [Microbacterium phage Piperis]